MSGRQCVLLDRDGTIIAEREYLADPKQVQLLPNSAAGLHQLQELGLGLIVVTNQSGIARGLFTEGDLSAVHDRMASLLTKEGVTLDGIYVCPHGPDDRCHCRKPSTGLSVQAAYEHGFALDECFVIGDKPCDVELGGSIGVKTILVRTGYGTQTEQSRTYNPDFVADDLLDAAELIERLLRDQTATPFPERISHELNR